MARYRRREARWVHAACVAGAYLVVLAGLYTVQLGAGLNVPVSVAIAAPPLVYAALAMVLLREAPFVRRLSWVGSACVAHVLLGALAAAELAWAGGVSLPVALAHVFVLFPPAPVLTLVATPLTLAAFGLSSSKPVLRAEPAPRPTPAARPKPLASPIRAAKIASPAAAPPAAAGRIAAVPARTAPIASPPPAAVPHPVPSAVTPAPAPAAWPPKLPRRADDGMVRVSFSRIAAQLPAEAFVLPFERLSESLREPHVVLVPRRVVLSQMRDGAVAITWAHIASQFPDLALGISDDEFRSQYPDLKLWLPMEELASQLPADAIVGAPAPVPNSVSTAVVEPAPVVAVIPTPPRMDVVEPAVVTGIVGCFSGVGRFEAATQQVADTTVVALVQPGLRRDAVSACAAPLMRSLGSTTADVITLRTEHAAIVVGVAPTPVVVAARLPGAPIALLAQRASRAAAEVGRGAPIVPAPARRTLEPVGVEGAVAQAAETVSSLGVVEPTVFADGAARVYVVSAGGGDDKAVAALALDLCEALGVASDLGRPRAVVFQHGRAHTLVRPLARGGVLAVTGTVTRAGRLFREVERAVSLLEAL